MNALRWKLAVLAPLAVALCTARMAAEERVAGELPRLTLEQAVQTALSKHPVLRQARLEVGSAELRVQRARSNRFVQIDSGGLAKRGLSGSANLFGLNGLAASPEPEGMAFSANFYQDILDFGRTRYQTAARRAEVEYYRQSLRAEEAELILRVKRAYYASLKAQARYDPARDAVKAEALLARKAGSLHRAQLGSKLEWSLAEARLSRARRDLAMATDAERQALAQLNTVMGEDTAQRYALQEPGIRQERSEDRRGLQNEAVEGRPEIAAVEARIRAAEQWVRRAEREKYPRIMGLFSGGWTRFAELTLSRLLFGGFGIQLPLFTGGRLEADVEETKLALERTEAVREELLRAVALQVAEAHSKWIAAAEAYRAAEEAVGPARAAETLARVRYNNELGARLEWMVARTVRSATESELAEALSDYKIAEAELDFAAGRRSF